MLLYLCVYFYNLLGKWFCMQVLLIQLGWPPWLLTCSCLCIDIWLWLLFHFRNRNLFNSFDTNKQGRVTLDVNQFIYCSEYSVFFISLCLLYCLFQKRISEVVYVVPFSLYQPGAVRWSIKLRIKATGNIGLWAVHLWFWILNCMFSWSPPINMLVASSRLCLISKIWLFVRLNMVFPMEGSIFL